VARLPQIKEMGLTPRAFSASPTRVRLSSNLQGTAMIKKKTEIREENQHKIRLTAEKATANVKLLDILREKPPSWEPRTWNGLVSPQGGGVGNQALPKNVRNQVLFRLKKVNPSEWGTTYTESGKPTRTDRLVEKLSARQVTN